MKKVLFVSAINLYPINAGNRVRITNLISMMRKMNYDIYYVHFGLPGNLVKRKTKEYFGENHCWFYDKRADSLVKKIHSKQRMLDESKSVYYSVDELIPNGFIGYLRRLQKENNFDVVIAEYVTSSKALTAFDKNVLKIIDTIDVLTDRNKIFEQLGQKPTGIYLKKKQEIKGLRRADVLLAIQDKEAKIFRKWMKDKRVYTVGNPVKIVEPHVTKNKKVLFVGSKNVLNRIAAEFCIKYLAPLLKEQGASMQIAGGVCEFFPDSKQYEKIGYVEDLADVYKNARLIINPIQGGTGLNIKSIEALGMAKPLITTKIGAKGLPNDILEICNTKEEFLQKISELLNNDTAVYDLSVKAYEYVSKYNQLCKLNLKKALQSKNNREDIWKI